VSVKGWLGHCERNPKKAYFAYRDALSPLLVNLRSDRLTYFAGEEVKMEAWVCNDTDDCVQAKMRFVVECGGKKLYSLEKQVETGECTTKIVANIKFNAPVADERKVMTVRMGLFSGNGNIMHDASVTIEIFPRIDISGISACAIGKEAHGILEKLNISQLPVQDARAFLISDIQEYDTHSELIEQMVRQNGATAAFLCLPPGEYALFGEQVAIEKSGSQYHFLSRNTGHDLVEGYSEFDFRFWYDNEKDRITPIADTSLQCAAMRPILLCGGDNKWEYAAAEMTCGKGRVIVCQVILGSHIENPVAADFVCRMLEEQKNCLYNTHDDFVEKQRDV